MSSSSASSAAESPAPVDDDDEEVQEVKPDVKPSFLKDYYLLGDATEPTRFPAPGVGEFEEQVQDTLFLTFQQLLLVDVGVDLCQPARVDVERDERTEAFAKARKEFVVSGARGEPAGEAKKGKPE
jgi:hypothetical protein